MPCRHDREVVAPYRRGVLACARHTTADAAPACRARLSGRASGHPAAMCRDRHGSHATMNACQRLDLPFDGGPALAAIAASPRRPRAAAVLAHGAGAGMDHPFMAAMAKGLAERGIASLRFQFPYMQAGRRRVDPAPIAHSAVRLAVDTARSMWPRIPMFAGGKSYGGRMTSQTQSVRPLAGVDGLLLLGFPLHPANQPSIERAAHLDAIERPMLFIHGRRDALAHAEPFSQTMAHLGPYATKVEIEGADHGFHVLKRSGRTDREVMEEVLDSLLVWTQAWQIR